jgi:hypothetical protein
MENLSDRYNKDVEDGDAEIECGEYTSLEHLKAELDSRVENYKNGAETVSPEDMRKCIEAISYTMVAVIKRKGTEDQVNALANESKKIGGLSKNLALLSRFDLAVGLIGFII